MTCSAKACATFNINRLAGDSENKSGRTLSFLPEIEAGPGQLQLEGNLGAGPAPVDSQQGFPTSAWAEVNV